MHITGETEMDDDLVQFKITAKNMGRICWFLLVAPFVIYLLVNIIDSGFGGLWNKIISVHSLYAIPSLITVYVVHEALHVIGGMINGIKFSSFSFGFDKPTLSIDCHCHEEMSIKTYLFVLLLPFLVLTPLLAYLAYFSNAHLWSIMLVLSTSGCAFDLTIAMGLIGIPGQIRIIPVLEGKNGYVYVKAAY